MMDGLIDGNRPSFDPIRQSRILHQLHDKRMRTARIFESVDRRDVGMIEGGQNLGFTLETGHAGRISGEMLQGEP